jgi:hypothetical protein
MKKLPMARDAREPRAAPAGAGAPREPDARYVEYMAERSSTAWENYIAALRRAGRAVEIDDVVIDGESIFRRRFACDTRTCAPTRNPRTGKPWRESGAKSCCADLTVDVAPSEIREIERHWPMLRAWLAARDAFFEEKRAKDCFELSADYEMSLKQRAGRCIFAVRDADWGIRCGIHAACADAGVPVRGVKPIVCDTFPLLVMDIARGRFYLGAHDADVDGLATLGDWGPDAFPCLRDGGRGERMYVAMRETIVAYFGEAFYAKLAAAAEEYLARKKPRPL